jgi:hypothetical protein
MTTPDNDISRRDFIRGTAGATLVGMTAASVARDAPAAESSRKTRVVLVRHKDATDGKGRANTGVIQQMMDDGVKAMFGQQDVKTCWRQLIKPSDVVGIKSNVWRMLPTPAAVERALVKRIREVGVGSSDIAIDDRGVRRNPVFRRATALINTRPMRTHHWSGLGGCVKNYIMFVPVPLAYHGRFCSPLGSIWKQEAVAGKTRLNVLVLLTPLFHGVGPHHYDAKHTWRYNGMLFSKDPVAIDSVGRKIIEAQRLAYFGEKRPFTPPTRHIDAAETEHHIGVADLAKIELVKLGWTDGVLL